MDLELFKTKTVAILEAKDDTGTVSALLSELIDMATIATAAQIQLQAALNKANGANATLQASNMELFLKIPVVDTGTTETKTEEEPAKELSMETLIESGALQGLI